MSEIDDIIRDFEDLNEVRRDNRRELKKVRSEIERKKRKVAAYIEARKIFKSIMRESQETIKEKIEGIVNIAIGMIYDRPFKYHLEFIERKRSVHCIPKIKEGEKIYHDPEYDLGHGIIDVISFAQRIAVWAIEGITDAVFIFDEPFKNLGKLVSRAGKMVKYISESLKIQFIIITHDQDRMECDRRFIVRRIGKRSIIRRQMIRKWGSK